MHKNHSFPQFVVEKREFVPTEKMHGEVSFLKSGHNFMHFNFGFPEQVLGLFTVCLLLFTVIIIHTNLTLHNQVHPPIPWPIRMWGGTPTHVVQSSYTLPAMV